MLSRKAATMLAPSSTRKVGGMEFSRCERDRDRTEVEQLLLALRVEVMPFDQHQLHWALEGWRRYGKGRHPAGLNLGDCFSYGLARALNAPLLFKGDDFAATDVAPALES